MYQFIPADYTKSSATFEETVEADATTFKPLGEKLAAYVRPSGRLISSLTGGAKGKGKAKGKSKTAAEPVEIDLTEDSDDAVVHEVYKVSESKCSMLMARLHGIRPVSKHITVVCSCSSFSLSKEVVMFTSVIPPSQSESTDETGR